MNDVMPYSKLNDNEIERISAKRENFSFTLLNNEPQSPIKQLVYDRINNWINDLNSKTLDDNTGLPQVLESRGFWKVSWKELENPGIFEILRKILEKSWIFFTEIMLWCFFTYLFSLVDWFISS